MFSHDNVVRLLPGMTEDEGTVRRIGMTVVAAGLGLIVLLLIPAAWATMVLPQPSPVEIIPAVVVPSPSGPAVERQAGATSAPTSHPAASPSHSPWTDDGDGDLDTPQVIENPDRVVTLPRSRSRDTSEDGEDERAHRAPGERPDHDHQNLDHEDD